MSPEETLPPATPGASAVAGIECPACGTQNTTDSKFCRQCGHLLRPLPGVGGETKKAVPVAAVQLEDDGDLTSPAEIDARRARHSLDRALLLSERGDLNAALLACRQAIALDHSHPEGYALLGTLLERNGDLRGAMSAYEHVLEISPDNELERDSLNRIKARLEKAPAFNFNPNDLFGEGEDSPAVTPPTDGVSPITSQESPATIAPERDEHGIEARLPPTSAALGVAAASGAAPVVFDFDPTPEGATPSLSPLASALDGETVARVGAALPPSSTVPPQTGTGGVPKIDRRVAQRRQVNIPIATERRMADRRASAVVTGATFAPTPTVWPARTGSLTPPVSTPSTVAPLDFSFGGAPTAPTPLWAQLLRGSSFYGRTLPLVVVGVLGLGFLSWARSQAVARDTEAASSAAATIVNPDGSTTLAQADPQGENGFSTGPALGVTPAPNTGDGFPITNATIAPAPPSAVPDSNPANTNNGGITPSARATGGTQGAANSGGRRANGNAGTPPFPVPIAPAPVPPPPAPSANNTGGGSNGSSSGSPIVLPPPQAPTGASGGNDSSRIRVGSLGTNPLNPGGSPQEGRIRITQGSLSTRPAAPPRTGTVAQGNERAAAAAAANGNQDRAINGLTNAINSSGSDQGFLLQQRAMAFMDRGDNARAVEDFQAAISAYQDQIGRGDNVASAQAGLRSARSGLNLALSRR